MATPAAVSPRPLPTGRALALATGLVLALAVALGAGVALGFALDDGGGSGSGAGRVAEASYTCIDRGEECTAGADEVVAEHCALDGVTVVRLTVREAFDGGAGGTREIPCG